MTESGGRRWWVVPLRLILSALMLGVLVAKVPDFDWGSMWPTWSATTLAWLATAGVLTFTGVVLSAFRWREVLGALGVRARFRRLVSHYLACQFVSNVLPTTIGGDVLRVTRLTRESGDGPDSFASVVLERLTGWLVLPVITIIGFTVNPGLRELGRATHVALAIAVATLLALGAVLFIADHPRLGGRFAGQEGWTRFLGAVHLGIERLRRSPRAALSVLAAGLLYQLVLVLAAVAAARALGIADVGLTFLLAFFPAVLIAQVLPIGISGLGVREGAFVLFLGPLGVPPEQAVALGLLLYGLNLAVSLAGAPAFAIGHRAGRDAPADTVTV